MIPFILDSKFPISKVYILIIVSVFNFVFGLIEDSAYWGV